MAQYHQTAASLKSSVVAAKFSAEQLSVVLKMMHGCVQLRQHKVIDSFMELMLPEGLELEGQVFKTVVAKKGEVLAQ